MGSNSIRSLPYLIRTLNTDCFLNYVNDGVLWLTFFYTVYRWSKNLLVTTIVLVLGNYLTVILLQAYRFARSRTWVDTLDKREFPLRKEL